MFARTADAGQVHSDSKTQAAIEHVQRADGSVEPKKICSVLTSAPCSTPSSCRLSRHSTRNGWWSLDAQIRQREPHSDIEEKKVRCRWLFFTELNEF